MPTVTEEKPTPAGRRSRYPKEFRRDAAALVIDQKRTVVDVARELGVVAQTLANWVRQERVDRGEREGSTTEDREEMARLRREVKRLTMERDLLKTKCGLLGEGVGPVSRYRHVSTMKAEGFPVHAACEAAEISTSAYYEWLHRSTGPTEGELDEAYLINQIRDIHAGTDATYGSPRVTEELRRQGYCANHKRIERLMREHDIIGVTERRRVRTTIQAEDAPPLPDLVEQRFAPGAPDVAWAGDITSISVG
jgi:transposase-like protein